MYFLVSILTDCVLVLCIILVCNHYLILEKADNISYLCCLSWTIVIISSIITNLYSNVHVNMIITIFVIIAVISLCYKEKFLKKMIISIWLFIVISILELIAKVGFQILFMLMGIAENNVVDLVAIVSVLIFIYVIGWRLSRKSSQGIEGIKIRYFVLYTVLAFVDELVLVMMAVVTLDEISARNKIYYGITSFLVVLGMFVQLGSVILLMVSRDVYKQKEEIVHKYLDEQQAHYEYLEKREVNTKKFRHDIRAQMYYLRSIVEESSEENKQHFQQILEKVNELRSNVEVNNSIVNAILNKYYTEATEKNIAFNVCGHMPDKCNIQAYDLCTIFSNLLSNAVEAVECAERKEITVDISHDTDEIIIVVSNYYRGSIETKEGEIITKKNDKNLHGWGMQNVKDSVNKYHGIMDIEITNNIFSVTILLKNNI